MDQEKNLEQKSSLLAVYIFGAIVFLCCFAASYKLWLNNSVQNIEVSDSYLNEQQQELSSIKAVAASANYNAVIEEEILSSDSLNPEFIINEGDTLSSILEEANISSKEAAAIINAFSAKYNPKKLNIGTLIEVHFDKRADNKSASFNSMIVNVSNIKKISVSLNSMNEFIAQELTVPLIQQITHNQGTIRNSFIKTALDLSIPSSAIMSMIRAFSYDVDFQRDIKNGNTLEVVMEKFYTEDGKLSHTGNILYSSLTLNDRKVSIYQVTGAGGQIGYYNEKGENIKKEFLRTPINAARISSKFGMRNHPVLGYTRMHKGVDFAAPVGTPILAAGSGVVESATRFGNYGKYIRIKHNSTYSTVYGHASRFAKGIRSGSKVTQGQVIAYVGTTGITSGPHLHYEVLEHGKQINPLKFKFSSNSEKLTGKAMEEFKQLKKKVNKYIKES